MYMKIEVRHPTFCVTNKMFDRLVTGSANEACSVGIKAANQKQNLCDVAHSHVIITEQLPAETRRWVPLHFSTEQRKKSGLPGRNHSMAVSTKLQMNMLATT